ncbi:hypothetical protein ACT17_22810 [Mycolicibacterium conceptionense]|uniref:Uncharacterized protein n=1 Tax=Mycolicibacterium conceptionense TaxID=451644 RepID=A0A0J8U660_9MYCO|nr:hypothetical protein [Mycolicibacterium conceptionense]KMV15930.1 hypothetical protein ACT17_22810 [Mycolicibacterium conceptionense]
MTTYTETGVYPLAPGDDGYGDGNGYRYAAAVVAIGGNSTSWHFTEAAAREALDERLAIMAQFWAEKLAWHDAGDRTPEGGYVIRIGGEHFVANHLGVDPNIRRHRAAIGHRGHIFRWRDLATGETRETNDLWAQGAIPAPLRDQLPDNATWLPCIDVNPPRGSLRSRLDRIQNERKSA